MYLNESGGSAGFTDITAFSPKFFFSSKISSVIPISPSLTIELE